MLRVAVFALGLALPRLAMAVPCTPQYDYLTNDPTEKVLVGCCKADGSGYKANGADCTNPANVCQTGSCSAPDVNGVKTCQQPTNGWKTGNNGGSCVVTDTSGNPTCELGACNAQVCVQQTDPETRCSDGNDCTDDTCLPSSTYAQPACAFTVDDTNSCLYADNDPCTDGVCVGGTCQTHQMPVGSACGSAFSSNPPQCEISACDANGLCVDSGQHVSCTGTLGVCRQWTCSLSQGCYQINAGTDLNSSIASGCETDVHDCKKKRCNVNGKCTTTREEPDVYICDTNFTAPELTDCIVGKCDGQKNCVNSYAFYDGQECSDGHTCTKALCSGGVCQPAATCHGSERTCPGCPGVACDPNQTVSNNNCNCAN